MQSTVLILNPNQETIDRLIGGQSIAIVRGESHEQESRFQGNVMTGRQTGIIVKPTPARRQGRKPTMAKTAAKAAPKSRGPRDQSKSAFVRTLPQELPAKEVVEKAKAAGMTLTPGFVNTIRSNDRKRAGMVKPRTTRTVLAKANGHVAKAATKRSRKSKVAVNGVATAPAN